MSRIFTGTGGTPTVPQLTEALSSAARAAGQAPSIHNTQPWRWRVGDSGLDLYLARERLVPNTDPLARLAILSCGGALHHARTALAAGGWQVEVTELPDPADPDHLAHITVYDRGATVPEALHRMWAMRVRRTDRRPVSATPVGSDAVLAIQVAVEEAGGWLYVVPRDEVVEVASATAYAQRAESSDPGWRTEIAHWTGGTRRDGTGVPDSVIPAHLTQTTVPGRDFGHPGTLPVGGGHDRNATYAILYGPQDLPVDWLRAGHALSAAWLTAVDLGVSVLPMSAAIEVPVTRHTLRRLLSGLGEPYLVLRLGIAAPHDGAPARTPRLAGDRTVTGEPG
jgi:nitroreductase